MEILEETCNFIGWNIKGISHGVESESFRKQDMSRISVEQKCTSRTIKYPWQDYKTNEDWT